MISSLLHAGTLVETAEGLKPIEEICEGDLVLAYDEATGEQAYKPVVQLFRNTTEEWYHIQAGGEEIICTGGHPFYVLNAAAGREKVNYEGCPENAKGTWICADELRSGDELLLADGTIVAIEAVTAEKLSEPETTYNFEVADFHTYYVSRSKVLTHNKCRKEWAKERKRYWKEQGEKYKNSVNKDAFSESGKYMLSKDNIKLMQKGKAPIGVDGKPVNLHHVNGIKTDPLNYIELTRTEHYANFKSLHPWL